jgi:hypothetical protein
MPSLFPDIKSKFALAAKKRYPNIPAMAINPSLEEEFARNADCLRLRLEYEELRRLCRNWTSMLHRPDSDERPPAYENLGIMLPIRTVSYLFN